MDYQTTLKYLYESAPMFQQIGGKAYKEGLKNTLELDKHFNHPHRTFRTIHIAGTNGKGSCSHIIAATLQSAGYKVGLYTSPHLIDFRERIRINGEMISEEYIIRFVEENRAFFEPLYPSFFELTTAMAFRYFADMKIDVAVVEVGLGGRLDCTNIIHPDLCVITNIGYDHMQYLGNTLEKIAKEKAGIIKEGVPVVIGRTNGHTRQVFTRKAQSVGAPILFAKEAEFELTSSYLSSEALAEAVSSCAPIATNENLFKKGAGKIQNKGKHRTSIANPILSFRNPEKAKCLDYLIKKNQDVLLFHYQTSANSYSIISELYGEYQKENGRTVLTAIEELIRSGYSIRQEDVQEGFGRVCELTGLMGRWQKLQNHPILICDTGHNVDGISHVVHQLNNLRKDGSYNDLHFVFGMVNDKDIRNVLKLLPKNATYYFTQASVQRALPAHELMQQAVAEGLEGNIYPTVVEAVAAAQEKSLPEDIIFVGGSSFIVADLLANRNALNLD